MMCLQEPGYAVMEYMWYGISCLTGNYELTVPCNITGAVVYIGDRNWSVYSGICRYGMRGTVIVSSTMKFSSINGNPGLDSQKYSFGWSCAVIVGHAIMSKFRLFTCLFRN